MTDLEILGKRAKKAKYLLAALPEDEKRRALTYCAEQLLADARDILAANEKDVAAAKEKGMHPGLLDRLRLDEGRIKAMSDGLLQVCNLQDPVGEVMDTFTRPNGLNIKQVRVPLGVVGIIYESRPNVTADAFALCFMSGNACILKGGSDCVYSNKAIVKSLRLALESAQLCPDAVQLIEDTDRAVTAAFMGLKEYVDVLIPRGGAGLIKSVVENSTIPVIETGTGNCHVYVDKDADLKMALSILINAKTQRIGVCNACESLVVHKEVADTFLPMVQKALQQQDTPFVELRCDEAALSILPDCVPATEADFATEYLDYCLSVKVVESLEEAVEHINRYNTGHSETIVTKDEKAAAYFLNKVDAACVYHNASTRFSDGFEFGFGAEIGISTQMLHARGPMGLVALTGYKYQIFGDGQIRG